MNRGFRIGIFLAITLLLTFAGQSWAQVKSPASVTSEDSLESAPIVEGGAAGPAKSGAVTASPGAFDFTRVILALAGVIALILILRTFAKRVMPGSIVHRASSAVKVLGRCTISSRQKLLVIQFGKRLVLVGDSGANLNPLCEISDPDEVAAIVAQARDESISVARRFESLFGRARKDFDEDEDAKPPDAFDESRDIQPDNPALVDTQKELTDLREKVRDVARQIGRA